MLFYFSWYWLLLNYLIQWYWDHYYYHESRNQLAAGIVDTKIHRMILFIIPIPHVWPIALDCNNLCIIRFALVQHLVWYILIKRAFNRIQHLFQLWKNPHIEIIDIQTYMKIENIATVTFHFIFIHFLLVNERCWFYNTNNGTWSN